MTLAKRIDGVWRATCKGVSIESTDTAHAVACAMALHGLVPVQP